ncbi:hypothetical protein GCM10009665_50190 [Kitasatospora nipponensis]|uniref:Uncharacterized protein n=1 Tax=Kitasatospora nipponensis TaxID=258049 RepID=A0ABN1WL48_9ACTN
MGEQEVAGSDGEGVEPGRNRAVAAEELEVGFHAVAGGAGAVAVAKAGGMVVRVTRRWVSSGEGREAGG